jgi:formylglycine-generating enzyme required for sulfatase activity
MHGNVAEWCRSNYHAYPYRDVDGRNAVPSEGLKVVRGGSWNDTLRNATSSTRWRYGAHKPVYNVGFRVVIEGEAAKLAHPSPLRTETMPTAIPAQRTLN